MTNRPHKGEQSPTTNWPTKGYTQEGNKRDFLRNKNNFEKPQRGEINTAWGSAPGNPSYDHVEYNNHLRLTGPQKANNHLRLTGPQGEQLFLASFSTTEIVTYFCASLSNTQLNNQEKDNATHCNHN